MHVQRTLPNPEDVAPFSSDDLTDELPAVAHATDNLPDRHSIVCQREDRGIRLLSTQIALVLEPLGSREQSGVDRRCADRGADLAHRLAHRIEERSAGVL